MAKHHTRPIDHFVAVACCRYLGLDFLAVVAATAAAVVCVAQQYEPYLLK